MKLCGLFLVSQLLYGASSVTGYRSEERRGEEMGGEGRKGWEKRGEESLLSFVFVLSEVTESCYFIL